MTTDRVHFYSTYDMGIPMYIDRMSEVVKFYEDGKQPDGINDYLEVYHIVQFVEHGKYPSDWDNGRISGIKQYKGKVAACFSRLRPEELLDDMVSKGWIGFDNHLLSPAEQDYFSYYLNNEKFTNGPAIRNNLHGTTPSYSEEKHKKNCFQLLMLFVLLLLKISEDLDMKRYLGKYGLE